MATHCAHCKRKTVTRKVYKDQNTGFWIYLCAPCEMLYRKSNEG